MLKNQYDMTPDGVDPAKYHPANDAYSKELAQAQAHIVHLTTKMKPKNVQIVKERHKGHTSKQISIDLKTSPAQVAKIMQSELGQKLQRALIEYQMQLEGPTLNTRQGMLWRIATDNEEDTPKVTISALGEMRAQDRDAWDRENGGGNQNTVVQIVINNETMPRGELD
jgi:hypothetical protein